MSSLSAIKTLLEADGTLLATATGGVWDIDESGPNGLSRTTTPAAFDSNEIIKPAILLKSRGARPDGVLADDANQYKSTQEVVEVWAYEDSGYSNIDTMLDRVYALLEAKQITGAFRVYWDGTLPQARDNDLGANVQRSDYRVYASKSV